MKPLPNTVVYVPTQEEYDELMQLLENDGWTCVSSENNPWRWYKSQTIVFVDTKDCVMFGEQDNVGKGCRIITLQEFKKEQGVDMYKTGDILVDGNGTERKVLGVCGEVYLMSWANRFDKSGNFYTRKELDEKGYRLYTEENPVEVTLEEIAELKGIDVSKLRIKE